MYRWMILSTLLLGLFPCVLYAGPIAVPLSEGIPVGVWEEGTGRTLILHEGALSLGEETPDGGWGLLGAIVAEGVIDGGFLGSDAEGDLWVAWRDETRLYAGKLQGASVTDVAEAPVFSLSSFHVTRTANEAWIRVGADGFFRFQGGVLEALQEPDFSMSSLVVSPSGVMAFGTSAGMVVYSLWNEESSQWGPVTDVTEGTFLWACVQGDGGVHLGLQGMEEMAHWSSVDGTLWEMAEPMEKGNGVFCDGTGFWAIEVSSDQESVLFDAVTGLPKGVLSSRVGQMGPVVVQGTTMVVSLQDLDAMARVGRLSLDDASGPAIGGVRPDPARAGENAALVGFRLMDESTVLSLDGESIPAGGEDPWLTQFFLDENVSGGPHGVTVVTSDGEDSAEISILAVPPLIEDVSPDPIPLGALVVVEGKHLEQVEQVMVGDTVQEITSVDLGAVVFIMDTETSPGSMNLEVSSPTGNANQLVSVVMPAPQPVKANPNPVKLGQFLTIEGQYMGELSLVTVGGVSVDIVANTADSVTVHISDDLAIGPQTVGMNGIGGASDPFGPISVLPAEPGGPVVTEWMPESVAPGQELYIRGVNLDAVEKVDVGGVEATLLTSGDTERRLMVPTGLPEGEAVVYLHGPESVQRGELMILKEGLPVPLVSSISVTEVAWGEELVLEGDGLSGVWRIYVGKTPHDVDNPENSKASVLILSTTVGGPQRVVAVGAGLSNELEVFVGLSPDEEEEEDIGKPESEEESVEELVVNTEDVAAEGPGTAPGQDEDEEIVSAGGDSGCKTQPGGMGLAWMLLSLLAVFRCRLYLRARSE